LPFEGRPLNSVGGTRVGLCTKSPLGHPSGVSAPAPGPSTPVPARPTSGRPLARQGQHGLTPRRGLPSRIHRSARLPGCNARRPRRPPPPLRAAGRAPVEAVPPTDPTVSVPVGARLLPAPDQPGWPAWPPSRVRQSGHPHPPAAHEGSSAASVTPPGGNRLMHVPASNCGIPVTPCWVRGRHDQRAAVAGQPG